MISRGVAESIAPAKVVLLPLFGLGVRAFNFELFVECLAACRPTAIGLVNVTVGRQGPNFRLDTLNRASLQWEDHAKWFAPLKRDGCRPACKFPVHRKGKRRPVSFDNAGQGLNSILWLVERACDHQVVTRLGTEQ